MGKLLRPQDRVLLVLSGIVDTAEEISKPRFYCYYDISRGWVPKRYKKTHLYATVRRALVAGHIERVIKEGKPHFRLTGLGRKKLVRDFPIFRFIKKKWDRCWVVVMFDIAEEERWLRDNLRGKLLELGFGMYQKSVYISPHTQLASDLAEFLILSGLKEVVQVMVGPWFLVGDEETLTRKVFKLDKLNKAYQKFLDDWEEGREIRGEKGKNMVTGLQSRYLEILANDPCLPKELLPDDWVGGKARKLIVNLNRAASEEIA